MTFTVLSVAYPFAPVGPDTVGGAEQVLTRMDAALVEAGHRSLVLAAPGSRVRGLLQTSGPIAATAVDDEAWGRAWIAHGHALARIVETTRVDVVHMHGVDFHQYLPPTTMPTVVTLHLPLAWYPPGIRQLRNGALTFNCVSRLQRARGGDDFADVSVVENGVPRVDPRFAKRRYAMAMGRICAEKGFHDAVDAARLADLPLALGGRVFPYPEHEAYFRTRLAPRLDGARRFLGVLEGARKRRLLASAQCLVVPSLVEETCSLVALEALAAGTPVVARRRGALVDVVEPGKTGFLVDDVREMAGAMLACRELDADTCRRAARERWPLERTVAGYLALYRRAIARQPETALPAPLTAPVDAPLA